MRLVSLRPYGTEDFCGLFPGFHPGLFSRSPYGRLPAVRSAAADSLIARRRFVVSHPASLSESQVSEARPGAPGNSWPLFDGFLVFFGCEVAGA